MQAGVFQNKFLLFFLYLISFFLPVIGWSFYFKSLEIPFVDLLALLALFFLFVSKIHDYFTSYHPKKISLPFFGAFLIFFLIAVISSFLNPGELGSIWYSIRWVLFFYIAFIVFPFNVLGELKYLKNILILITISGLFLAVVGFFSLFLQDLSDPFFRSQPLPLFGDWIFGQNYNLMAEFLIIVAFLVLALKYFYKSFRVCRFLDVLFVFLVLVNLLTFGRTAWLTLLLQVVTYFSIYYLIIKREKLNVRDILIAFFFLAVLVSPFFVRAINLQEVNFSSTQNRVLLTKISWEALKDKPFFGHGGGEFISLVSDNTRFVAKYGEPLDSHGFGQKIIAEYGLLGIISFLVFLFLIFRFIYKGVINNKEHYKLLLPLFVAAFGGYFYQLFNTSYYKGRAWIPIALALIAVSILERNKNNPGIKIKSNIKNV